MNRIVFSQNRDSLEVRYSNRQKRLTRIFFVFLLLFQFVASGFAQFPPFDLGDKYRLIPSRRYPSEPIKTPGPLRPMLRSGYKVSIIGGIVFDGVAMPINSLQIDTLALIYNPMNADGARLAVFINDKTYSVLDLPDWQLVPIAKYADSPYIACVSLFGKLQSGTQPPPGTKYVVGYHPAFENTLLGLRLFQTDFYLLDPSVAGELPSLNGDYILGHGEDRPDPDIWQDAARKLNQLFGMKQLFRSYVICDYQRQVTFSIDSTRLVLDSYPYFYFWSKGKTRVERIEEAEMEFVVPNSFYVIHLKELSEKISSQIELLHDANPAVFNSLVAIMRYSAFFRYCKQRNLKMWNTFLEEIANVSISPQVETPSIIQGKN